MRIFLLVWFGQVVSLTGSAITAFALGVWVFQKMGSVTDYSLISVSAILPFVLVSPFAGAVVDRYNRREVMIHSDLMAGLCTLTVAFLFMEGQLFIWQICLMNIFNSAFSAFQQPAFTAATRSLVDDRYIDRAAGLMQAGRAVSRFLISPLLAGLLFDTIGLWGILCVDVATFVFSYIILLAVKIPDTETSQAGAAGKGSLLRETFHGWRYILRRSGLFGLLLFFAAANFFTGLAYVLFTPLVLTFSSASVLGGVVSIGGFGMLIGGLGMGLWRKIRRRMDVIFGFTVLIGCCLSSIGFLKNIQWLGAVVFLYFFSRTVIAGSVQVLIHKYVEPDLQGRVFSMTGAIAGAALPLAYVIAGPLADYLFRPLAAVKNQWLDPLCRQSIDMIGIDLCRYLPAGDGAGMRFMYILIGIAMVLTTLTGILYSPLRNFETEATQNE